jgi:hypothetical protein
VVDRWRRGRRRAPVGTARVRGAGS